METAPSHCMATLTRTLPLKYLVEDWGQVRGKEGGHDRLFNQPQGNYASGYLALIALLVLVWILVWSLFKKTLECESVHVSEL